MTDPEISGRCYSPAALRALADFCQNKDLHLISDEIYALSVYQRPNHANESFTSVLSMGQEIISPDRVHVLYGLSKVRSIPHQDPARTTEKMDRTTEPADCVWAA